MIGFVGVEPRSLGFIGLVPSLVVEPSFVPDFEQFFQVNIQETSAQFSVRHPLFTAHIERPALIIWLRDYE